MFIPHWILSNDRSTLTLETPRIPSLDRDSVARTCKTIKGMTVQIGITGLCLFTPCLGLCPSLLLHFTPQKHTRPSYALIHFLDISWMLANFLLYVESWEQRDKSTTGSPFKGHSQSSGVIGADGVRTLFYLLGPHFTITALNGILLKLTPAAFYIYLRE